MCSVSKSAMKEVIEVIVQDSAIEKRDKLFLKSEARLAELERKRAPSNRTSLHEQTDYFASAFASGRQRIEAKLQTARDLPSSLCPSHFDDVTRDVQALQKFLSDATLFLPMYDVKRGQEALRELQDKVQGVQEELMPKRKFAFKIKKKQPNGFLKDELDTPTNGILVPSAIDPFECGFNNQTNKILTKYSSEIQERDVSLHHLQDCTVHLQGNPSTLFISNLQNCKVFCGPVNTSIFVENCTDCTFTVACQQLRIHSTLDSRFYLHVTSRSIIEDSRGLQFAPYNCLYPDIDSHFESSKLDRSINNWRLVDDFNWLAFATPSPNWSILQEVS